MLTLPKNNPTPDVTNDDRYEIKYTVRETDLKTVTAWLRSHPAAFRTAYPARKVNNIYFDSPDWSNLNAGLAGVAERGKLRLRWYGDCMPPEQMVLENKQKRGQLGRKLSHKITAPFDVTRLDSRALLKQLATEDLGELWPLLATQCCPVLVNQYHREYFISADRDVRLTIDTRVRFYRQNRTTAINFRFAEPMLGAAVVEIKAGGLHSQAVSDIAAHFPFRATAFSKYGVGLLDWTYLV